MLPKTPSLGHEKSNRNRTQPALSSRGMVKRRGHPSRVPFDALRAPWTGPVRAAEEIAEKRKGQAVAAAERSAHSAAMDQDARNGCVATSVRPADNVKES